ncbi:hypothetical protein DFH28DRAFT_928180 [Melampsora americana]|nr:hypothetical protein DFH28DRAFT_928180 [Melampsora americana]
MADRVESNEKKGKAAENNQSTCGDSKNNQVRMDYTASSLTASSSNQASSSNHHQSVVSASQSKPLEPKTFLNTPADVDLCSLWLFEYRSEAAVSSYWNDQTSLLFKQTSCRQLPTVLQKDSQCKACRARSSGDIRAFPNIQHWKHERQGSQTKIPPPPIFPLVNQTANKASYQHPIFPSTFNQPAKNKAELIYLQNLIATSLKPILEHELKWYQDDQSVSFIGRDISTVTCCSYCFTTLIGSDWMCEMCGEEACQDCYALFTGTKASQEESNDIQPNQKNSHMEVSHLAEDEIPSYFKRFNDCNLAGKSNQQSPVYNLSSIEQYLYKPPGLESDLYYKISAQTLASNPSFIEIVLVSGCPLVIIPFKLVVATPVISPNLLELLDIWGFWLNWSEMKEFKKIQFSKSHQ